MARMKIKYLLELEEADAVALRNVLNRLGDSGLVKLNVWDEDRQRIRNIYDVLPIGDYHSIKKELCDK